MINWIKNKLTKHLFCLPDYRQVIHQDPKTLKVYIGGVEFTENEVKGLKEEVAFFKNTRLFSTFINTVAETARQTAFERSTNFEDMKTAKLMLLNLETLKQIMSVIENFK